MRKDTLVFDSKFLKVYSTRKDGGFYYAERLGKDSVAFVLVSKDKDDKMPFGLITEFKDPIDKFLTTGFGGSMDKDVSKIQLVKEEVIEESGFDVEEKDIHYVGRVLCSTQMNQFVYLYYVDVDKSKQGEKTTDNPSEKKAKIVWVNKEIILKLLDWKSVTILAKAGKL